MHFLVTNPQMSIIEQKIRPVILLRDRIPFLSGEKHTHSLSLDFVPSGDQDILHYT